MQKSSQGSYCHFLNLDFKIEGDRVYFVEMNDGLLRADYARYDALVDRNDNAMREAHRYLAQHYKTLFVINGHNMPFYAFNQDQSNIVSFFQLSEFIAAVKSGKVDIEGGLVVISDYTTGHDINPVFAQAILEKEGISLPVQAGLSILRACGDKITFSEVFSTKKEWFPETTVISRYSIKSQFSALLERCEYDEFIIKPSTAQRAEGVVVVPNRKALITFGDELDRLLSLQKSEILEADILIELDASERKRLAELANYLKYPYLCSFIVQRLIAPHDNRTGRVMLAFHNGKVTRLLQFWRCAPGNGSEVSNQNCVSLLEENNHSSKKDKTFLVRDERELQCIDKAVTGLFEGMTDELRQPSEHLCMKSSQIESAVTRDSILIAATYVKSISSVTEASLIETQRTSPDIFLFMLLKLLQDDISGNSISNVAFKFSDAIIKFINNESRLPFDFFDIIRRAPSALKVLNRMGNFILDNKKNITAPLDMASVNLKEWKDALEKLSDSLRVSYLELVKPLETEAETDPKKLYETINHLKVLLEIGAADPYKETIILQIARVYLSLQELKNATHWYLSATLFRAATTEDGSEREIIIEAEKKLQDYDTSYSHQFQIIHRLCTDIFKLAEKCATFGENGKLFSGLFVEAILYPEETLNNLDGRYVKIIAPYFQLHLNNNEIPLSPEIDDSINLRFGVLEKLYCIVLSRHKSNCNTKKATYNYSLHPGSNRSSTCDPINSDTPSENINIAEVLSSLRSLLDSAGNEMVIKKGVVSEL